MIRQPRVVDVVRAVQRVAPAHGEVLNWWYAPLRRVGPDVAPAGDGRTPACVIVIEQASSEVASSCETIARELGEFLGEVSVRRHRGQLEQGSLIRLVSDAVRPHHRGGGAC
jgi:hypothetical protein